MASCNSVPLLLVLCFFAVVSWASLPSSWPVAHPVIRELHAVQTGTELFKLIHSAGLDAGIVRFPDGEAIADAEMAATAPDATDVLDTPSQHNVDTNFRPVVMMHGMGDCANNPLGMEPMRKAISKQLNGTYVKSVALAPTCFQDALNTFLMNMNREVETFAQAVWNDSRLAQGFNAIGFSQGNLIIRGYIERFNSPPVHNYVSMHGPMTGVAGFPNCNLNSSFCLGLAELLGSLAYNPFMQGLLAQANYYRDPKLIEQYVSGNTFLVPLNNEAPHVAENATLKKNFLRVNKMVMIKALGDTVVQPRESEWWGFYKDGSYDTVLDMKDTWWYRNDSFGLRSLDERGDLSFLATEGNHLQFNQTFLTDLVAKFFTN